MKVLELKNNTIKNIIDTIHGMPEIAAMPIKFNEWAKNLKRDEVAFVVEMEFPTYSDYWVEHDLDNETNIPQEIINEYSDFSEYVLQKILDSWYL